MFDDDDDDDVGDDDDDSVCVCVCVKERERELLRKLIRKNGNRDVFPVSYIGAFFSVFVSFPSRCFTVLSVVRSLLSLGFPQGGN